MDRLKSFIFLLASLVLPMVVFSATLAIDGYYPFGERALLASDLEIHYIDFFSWFSDVVHGEASPFFSFASGLGSNMWGTLSYYLSSPFSLLVLFFDEGQMPLFVYVISLVKIACMSLCLRLHCGFGDLYVDLSSYSCCGDGQRWGCLTSDAVAH